jgi:hypothetical protein
MNWLPEEIIQLIYVFDGRYKQYMRDCFSIIDVQKHLLLTEDNVKVIADITPYNLVRTYHYDYINLFGLKRKPIIPKNGIEVLNKSWVEKNKAFVVKYMAI